MPRKKSFIEDEMEENGDTECRFITLPNGFLVPELGWCLDVSGVSLYGIFM